jgi:hypothetical protein
MSYNYSHEYRSIFKTDIHVYHDDDPKYLISKLNYNNPDFNDIDFNEQLYDCIIRLRNELEKLELRYITTIGAKLFRYKILGKSHDYEHYIVHVWREDR